MHAWQPIPSARLHARLPQDSMVIVAGVTCTIAIFDFEKLVREALTFVVHVGKNGHDEAYGKVYNGDVDDAA